MKIELEEACGLLAGWDDILILSHQNPDGDTLGSAFALYYALRGASKRVRVECADGFPARYGFLYGDAEFSAFAPRAVVAVDVADPKLLGHAMKPYAGAVDLCIDHHPSNTLYAKRTLLSPGAAATAEVVARVLDALRLPITPRIASCLYTGIATDTGCFRYSNTTADTHRLAARLMETGVDFSKINRVMFEVKSISRIAIEQQVLSTMQYFLGGRCAVIYITQEMLAKAGAQEAELDSVSAIPRQIEGVEVGVTLRQRANGYKVSVRTNSKIDAAKLCATLGGGGHVRAAGCMLHCGLSEAIDAMVCAVQRAMEEQENEKGALKAL